MCHLYILDKNERLTNHKNTIIITIVGCVFKLLKPYLFIKIRVCEVLMFVNIYCCLKDKFMCFIWMACINLNATQKNYSYQCENHLCVLILS